MKVETAIIGGGVIGLSIGWRLAQAGQRVVIVERGKTGMGASHAAAGMLAAGVEVEPTEGVLWQLNRRSQQLWPDFARELEAASRMAIHYRREGTLSVALSSDDLRRLQQVFEFQRGHGVNLEWLSAAFCREREPALSSQIKGGIFSPADHQVDNRLLAQALRQAFLTAGGQLIEDREARLVESNQRITGIDCGAAEPITATHTLLAGGAWSGRVAGLPNGVTVPIRPIKGQMLAVESDLPAPIASVVWSPTVYLVPRENGRLLIGATVEEAGFDPRLSFGGIFGLMEGAWRVLPALEEAKISEFWSGFRPGSPDDAPMLGEIFPGLILASGHHRNGILLTPITAALISEHILNGTVLPEAFLPHRF
ncbi:MAG: glycine oxidase ThiO [Alphaproteobacteria bacterium]|nr:glycine oxidase ThiO [Alphaproteobacteria bacterium]